jgi:putative flippase GtrA
MRLSKRFTLFCVFGLIATLIDLSAFNLYLFLTNTFIISRIGGVLTSLIFTFSCNRKITFKSKNTKIKTQFIKFLILYLTTMTLNTLVGLIVIFIAGKTTLIVSNIAAIMGILVSMTLNYIGSKYLIFHK